MNETQPDLEKSRDEKCAPVVEGMMEDLAALLIPENANEKIDYNPVILALQKRALDADLNIVMEVPYVFQLITGLLQGLNLTVQKCKFVEADDLRYGAISKQILTILAQAKLPATGWKEQDADIVFAPIKDQLEALFSAEKLTFLEIKYVMDNVFDAYKDVTGAFDQLLAQQEERGTAKAYGLASKNDLTLKRLDEVLKL